MNPYGNPFLELDALRRGIEDLFVDLWPAGLRRGTAFLPGRSARGYPLLNISQTGSNVVVDAFAPGLDSDSLQVSVDRNVLTISGEKKRLAGIKPEAYHRNERATGKFTRALHLDSEIDQNKVEARYEDGILRITLPKAESALPRKVDVRVQ